MRENIKFYWITILFLQILIVLIKASSEQFYVWNILLIISIAVFLFYRLKQNIPLIKAEITLAAFVGVNALIICINQLNRLENLTLLMLCLIIVLISCLRIINIRKSQK